APTPPLFPYTTLFRSQILADHGGRPQIQDLLGTPVERPHFLVTADGDDAARHVGEDALVEFLLVVQLVVQGDVADGRESGDVQRSEEHTSELQSRGHL